MSELSKHEFNKADDSELCVCGSVEQDFTHPHEFKRNYGARPYGSETRCICTLPLSAPIHIWKSDR